MSARPATLETAVWQRLASVDRWLLLAVRRFESRAVTRLMKAFTQLGDCSSWVVVGLVLGLSGGEGPRQCALIGAAAGLAVSLSQALKRVCRRPRPDCRISGFAALAENPDAFSFPSGHTCVAFAVAAAFAGEGSGLAALTLALAAGIALSRVYLGAHYPMDVAAGVLVGSLSGWAACTLASQIPLLKFLGYATLAWFV